MSKATPAMMQKIARDLQMMGLTVVSQSQSQVQILNGSNNLYVSYINEAFSPSVVGGIDDTISPFLGIGTSQLGQLSLQSVGGSSIPAILDGAIAAQVFAELAGFANDIILADNSASAGAAPGVQLARIRGDADLLNMGQ
jgi:hypothetical protein